MYATIGLESLVEAEIHAFNDVTLFPAKLLILMVGLDSSSKFGAEVMVAFLGMLSSVTVPLNEVLDTVVPDI